MIQFSERKEQNDRLEEQIFFWKQEYQKPEMSKEQYHRLLARMEEAKKDKKKEQRKRQMTNRLIFILLHLRHLIRCLLIKVNWIK